jgi:hypothetical protein
VHDRRQAPDIGRRVPPINGLAGAVMPHHLVDMLWLSLVSLLLVLFLVARGTSGSRMLVIVAVTLAVITVIVFAERGGVWPDAFRQP